jgi:hypothetical protein
VDAEQSSRYRSLASRPTDRALPLDAYLGDVGVLARFEPQGCHALGTDLPHSPPSSDLSAGSQLAAAATKRVRP